MREWGISMADEIEGIAGHYHDAYKSWLKHTARITSMHNAVSFIKHQVTDWHHRWGLIKTDRVAQALHEYLMK